MEDMPQSSSCSSKAQIQHWKDSFLIHNAKKFTKAQHSSLVCFYIVTNICCWTGLDPNIILLLGICSKPQKLAIITEFVDNGSLFDLLHRSK